MFFILPSVPPRSGSTLGYYCIALSEGSEFLGLSARQSPIYCAEGGFFQNVADISILYKIFETRVTGKGKIPLENQMFYVTMEA